MDRDLTTPRIVVAAAPTEADRAAILAGLAAFNRGLADPGVVGPLAVLIQDGDGATIGGLWGRTLFRWLHIELVFVPPDLRGAARGRVLVREAEAVAAESGCIGAFLETYSFQARGFYEKLGYRLVGSIEDCPPGVARHILQKRFA